MGAKSAGSVKNFIFCGRFQDLWKEVRQIITSKASHIFLEEIVVIHVEKLPL